MHACQGIRHLLSPRLRPVNVCSGCWHLADAVQVQQALARKVWVLRLPTSHHEKAAAEGVRQADGWRADVAVRGPSVFKDASLDFAVDGRAASHTTGQSSAQHSSGGYIATEGMKDADFVPASNTVTGAAAAAVHPVSTVSHGATAGEPTSGQIVHPAAERLRDGSANRMQDQLQRPSPQPSADLQNVMRMQGQMGESFTGSCHSAGRGATSRSSQSGSEMLGKSEPGAPSGGNGALSWLFGR